MKKAHTLYAPQLLEKLQLSYPNIYQLLKLDEGDTMQEVLTHIADAGLQQDDLPLMEAVLKVFPEYKTELPFPDDDAVYAQRLHNNYGLALIQKYFDYWHA